MKPFIWCIFGKRGSGKSYLARREIRNLATNPANIIIYDPMPSGEYRELCGEKWGFALARNLADLTSIWNEQVRAKKNLRLIFWPDGTDSPDGDFLSTFETLARLVKVKTRGTIFVIEEADLFCSANYISPSLRWIVNYGRHAGQSIIAISRRHAAISRELTSQADRVLTFKQSEPRDIAILEELGFPASRVRNLKLYDYLEKIL
jgi:hypothetical protein